MYLKISNNANLHSDSWGGDNTYIDTYMLARTHQLIHKYTHKQTYTHKQDHKIRAYV